MLNIQEALLSGKTPDDLNQELAIGLHAHPTLPLIGFSYNQIDSPKTNPIVREARGIVLEKDTWKVVAKAFNRFFNDGEVQEEYETFNWDNFTCVDKADGSLIIVFNYKGQWYAKTRGSFGNGQVPFPKPGEKTTFTELFWKLAEGLQEKLKTVDPNLTLVFEMCSLYNKVVRMYKEPKVYLLSVFDTSDLREFSEVETTQLSKLIGIERPEIHDFKSRI